jgi:predicted deacylase
MSDSHFYPIGTAGLAWGATELAQWRAKQVRQRSYADDVLSRIERLRERFDLSRYGEVAYEDESFPLMALCRRSWQPDLPTVLVTGGVHGYETSGVHGALRFVEEHAQAYAGRVNLLVVPCVSPWAYERIQRWNYDAIDPNRSFFEVSPAQESAALMRLVAPLRGQFVAHIDLHEPKFLS